jgi:outer membrane protein assembly factor BamB
MKKSIFRNLALISAIGVLAFSFMLITNYFQVHSSDPLDTGVLETLKQLNDANSDNAQLQEQIRQLDLLARRAYFVNINHLETGVYILIGMLVVLVISLRFYYAADKDIPGKELAPVDEWIEKTHARRYVGWSAGLLAAVALVFAFLSSPLVGKSGAKTAGKAAQTQTASADETTDALPPGGDAGGAAADTAAAQAADNTAPVASTPAASTDTASAPAGQAKEAAPVAETPSFGFRGNNSNGHTTAKNIPTSWDLKSGKNIAWKAATPKPGYNSPIIADGKVFMTGADAQSRELYAFDLATGKLLWTLKADNIPGSPGKMPKVNTDTGLAASTAATNGKQVCAIFATGDLLCADMDGKRLWAKNLGVPDNHYGYASSLLSFGNLLIVEYRNSTNPRILALDMATGQERWSTPTSADDKITWSSPIIAYIGQKPILATTGTPAISAYDPSTGKPLWRVEGLSGEIASSPCSAAGLIFGATEYAALIAVDGTTGKQLWTANDFLPEVSSLVATKACVYVATSYGTLACYDAKTGKLLKENDYSSEAFYSSPVIAEGKLFLFANSGDLYIFSADAQCKQLAEIKTGERTFATPAFTDGRIVVRTEKSVYCVKAN